MRRLFPIAVACLLAAGFPSLVRGSLERGVVRGTVTDQQGADVPNADVAIRNVDTNVVLHATTNSSGFYLVPELVPGNYTVNVQAAGFVPVDVSNIVVKANAVSTVDVAVTLGKTTQHVEVTAAVQHVDTTAANFGESVQ